MTLIQRLCEAERASRELDGLIWPLADREAWERNCWFVGKKYAGSVYTLAEKMRHAKVHAECYAPAYTASIDAALTLVPKEWCWQLEADQLHNPKFAAYCRMAIIDGSLADDWDVAGNGATPALALCIAAIKAREIKEG